jgi:hypothetical protein
LREDKLSLDVLRVQLAELPFCSNRESNSALAKTMDGDRDDNGAPFAQRWWKRRTKKTA